jgi:hypothetical protein
MSVVRSRAVDDLPGASGWPPSLARASALLGHPPASAARTGSAHTLTSSGDVNIDSGRDPALITMPLRLGAGITPRR